MFSEPVKGVTATTFVLTNLGNGKKVNATVTLSANGRTATLKPNAKIASGRQYRVQVTNAIRDLGDNRLAVLTWRFHT